MHVLYRCRGLAFLVPTLDVDYCPQESMNCSFHQLVWEWYWNSPFFPNLSLSFNMVLKLGYRVILED